MTLSKLLTSYFQAVTLLQTLIDLNEDAGPKKVFQGLSEQEWHHLAGHPFVPLTEVWDELKLGLVSRITAPENLPFCFTQR